MAPPHTNFELMIEKMVYGGDGLGRLDGRVVLTPFVLPGELVEVEPASERGGLLRAKCSQVLSAAPARVDPPCPYFTRCGGCHYQHASYEAQLEAKRAILAEVLRRVGKLNRIPDIAVVAGNPWGYRNRSQFHLRDGAIGYRQAHSHKLCPVSQCPISSPRINETLATLMEMIRDSRWPKFVHSLEVFTNETEVQLNVLDTDRPVARRFFEWCAEKIPGAAAGTLDYDAAGFRYRVGNKSFFQVNRFLLDDLVGTAVSDATGETALDLYAGVGLFSLPLVRRFRAVTAVESGAGAIRDLIFNGERAGLPFEIAQSTSEIFLRNLNTAPDFVLADPPRAGLGKIVVRRLTELGPPRITIVACDPATLARDLAGLAAAGYELKRLTMIDLFPQTFHIETVAELGR